MENFEKSEGGGSVAMMCGWGKRKEDSAMMFWMFSCVFTFVMYSDVM